ncbi:hypothetical protein KJ853_01975 [Patescibacteria group bacterium]|nr:hypothetical protein [Patescibacteria group bacterium]
MIRKILRIAGNIIYFLLPTIAVLFAALGTIRQPRPLNIFVLISLTLGFIWIIYIFFSLKKEKRLSDERAKQDRIRQKEFFSKLEKRFGKKIADQFR